MATTVYGNTITNSNTCSSGQQPSKYKLYLQLTENSYDITTNTSNVSYTGWIQGINTVTTFWGYAMNGSITHGGTTLASGSATATRGKPVSSANPYVLATGTSNFTHNNDGTLTITLTFNYSSTAPHATAGSVTTSLTLTRIPRASTITAIDCDIESATTININKTDPSFTTTIAYSFSGSTNSALTGTIVTKTPNTSYGWTVPSSFYAKIPNDKTGTCTLTATTYNGDTSVGTSTTTFKVKASEETSAPTGSMTVVDSNSTTTNLTGDSNKIVKGYSTALCTITKSARNSATITSVKINEATVGTSASTYSITNATTNVFNLAITDSRGYTTNVPVTKTLIDYIPLTCKATFTRNTATDGKVNLTYNGNYFNSTFGSTANTLTVKYKYKEKSSSTWSDWTTITPTKSGNTYSQTVQLSQTFDYSKNFDFVLQVSDKLVEIPVEGSVTKGEPIFWWNDRAININVDTYIKGSLVCSLEAVYPVGSIYITVANQNPAALFGFGTWEQIQDRFLLASGPNYPVGTVGGSTSHTHTLGNGFACITYIWTGNENRLLLKYGTGSFVANRYTNSAGASYVEANYDIGNAVKLGGSTDSGSNMPPYIAVYVWKRVS